jgi:arylformamidase
VTTRYRGYDQAELDRQYSPSSRVPDISVFLHEYATRSELARAGRPVVRHLRYGPEPRETLDFFPADRPDAPLLVFVHGGYWQELSKDESAFPARGLTGAAFAALGYGLAPDYRLDEIVTHVRRGLWWLVRHAEELGVLPTKIHLAGHCAGAHLVAMALRPGWLPDGRHPCDVFAGATLLSGVYDLRPLRLTYVNTPLGLTAADARELSPALAPPDRLPPLTVARGGVETEEFVRQHNEFVRLATPSAAEVLDIVVPHRNHFDIPFDLDDPATALGAAVFARLDIQDSTVD